MQHHITSFPETKLVGLKIRTSFQLETSPETSQIHLLVGRYFAEQIAQQIPNRLQPNVTFSTYSDYELDYRGEYTYFIGEAVTSYDGLPKDLETLTIPSAIYAKFTTQPDWTYDLIYKTWQQIWNTSTQELGGERLYQVDFEVYDGSIADPQHVPVSIYVGIFE